MSAERRWLRLRLVRIPSVQTGMQSSYRGYHLLSLALCLPSVQIQQKMWFHRHQVRAKAPATALLLRTATIIIYLPAHSCCSSLATRQRVAACSSSFHQRFTCLYHLRSHTAEMTGTPSPLPGVLTFQCHSPTSDREQHRTIFLSCSRRAHGILSV